jgi:hypothetical protein
MGREFRKKFGESPIAWRVARGACAMPLVRHGRKPNVT